MNRFILRTTNFDSVAAAYIRLEIRVNRKMTQICDRYCRNCSKPCCVSDYCRETGESPFLSMILDYLGFAEQSRSNQSWLGQNGCRLSAGRPPVCYEFFCSRILADQPDMAHRYVLNVLGALVCYVGQNARGRRHLVEIVQAEDLKRLSFSRIEVRLRKARAAFEAAALFFENGTLDHDRFAALSEIRPLPRHFKCSTQDALCSGCRDGSLP